MPLADAAPRPDTLEGESITIEPSKIVGGDTATGMVTLNRAPDIDADGDGVIDPVQVFVFDSLGNEAVARVVGSPVTITGPGDFGDLSARDECRDAHLPHTALQALNGDGTSTVTPSVTVHVVPTATTDLITVTKAALSKSAKLTVVAESDNPNAVLSAFLDGAVLGELRNGRATFQLPSVDPGLSRSAVI